MTSAGERKGVRIRLQPFLSHFQRLALVDQTQERVVKATNRMEREMAETKMKIRDDAMRQTETRFRIFRSYLVRKRDVEKKGSMRDLQVIAWVGSNVAFVGFVSSFALQTTSYFGN
jgi:hypothetical protein